MTGREEEVRAAADELAIDLSGVKPHPPGFSEEVLARAVEAGTKAEWEKFGVSGESWEEFQDDPRCEIWLDHVRAVLDAAAPIIAEAAYRAGIAEVWKAIEAEADRYGKQAQMLNSPDSEEAEAVLRDMLSKLKSAAALTDTEGQHE